jgi:hypothetical protein
MCVLSCICKLSIFRRIFISFSSFFQNHQNRVRVLQARRCQPGLSQGRPRGGGCQLHLQVLDPQTKVVRQSAAPSSQNRRVRTLSGRRARQRTRKAEKVCRTSARSRTSPESLLHGQQAGETPTVVCQAQRTGKF